VADDNQQQPVVIKRIRKIGAAAHGGAWKIAYADFVTAMMAFFLLMWLLGSTSQGDLEGISEYFKTPLKVALAGGASKSDNSSVIKGGGKDQMRSEGQIKKGDVLKSVEAELKRAELKRLEDLKRKIETAIEANPTLRQFQKQLLLDITTEGLRIQIVDEKNRPMFASGKAELQSYTRDILREIGRMLNEVDNKISLSGHTDAAPYPSGEKAYSNWELSADRANASRRELIVGGMSERKVLRVVGLSSAVMLDKSDAFNPINRRISIIVMNKKTEEAITKDSPSVEIESQGEVTKEKISGADLKSH
jgi:chemotaxis protein MotB